MRYLTITAGILGLALMAWMPLTQPAAADQSTKPMSSALDEPTRGSTTALGMPLYNPPKRGAPGGRVGGGTRGSGDDLPVVSVLAPDHVGLTVQEQPSLYWYLSKATTFPVELVIIISQGIQPTAPLMEKRIPAPAQPGVHRIRLADFGVRLSTGAQYQWFVSLVRKPDRRSNDVIAGGFIERVAPPEAVTVSLAQAGNAKAPHVYAESGLWYDAVMALSEMIEAAPKDRGLRQQRAALMKQVRLPEIAEYDLKQPTAD